MMDGLGGIPGLDGPSPPVESVLGARAHMSCMSEMRGDALELRGIGRFLSLGHPLELTTLLGVMVCGPSSLCPSQ